MATILYTTLPASPHRLTSLSSKRVDIMIPRGLIITRQLNSISHSFRAKFCQNIEGQKILQLRSAVRSTHSSRKNAFPNLIKTATSVGVLLAIANTQMSKNPIRLEAELGPQIIDYHLQVEVEAEAEAEPSTVELIDDEPEIQGLASIQKLSFGTVVGICTGVFVRKGLSLIAFLFGGGFVFLQYLHSRSLIRINWKNWSDRYESRLSSSKVSQGGTPSKGIVARFLDFLTSDFQYRSTFLVGFVLGLRIG